MRDGAVGVDLYNAQVTGVGDAPPRQLGRRPRPVRNRAYGASFDIHYGCPRCTSSRTASSSGPRRDIFRE